jgi:hypothetical protein
MKLALQAGMKLNGMHQGFQAVYIFTEYKQEILFRQRNYY